MGSRLDASYFAAMATPPVVTEEAQWMGTEERIGHVN